RAGGIAFSRQYLPDRQAATAAVKSADGKIPYYRTKEFVEHFTVQKAKSQDVVLLGFENEKEERLHLTPPVQQLLSHRALSVFLGANESPHPLRQKSAPRPNPLSRTHAPPNGATLSIPGGREKICPGGSIVNRLYLWTFQGELISAFMRRGKLPGILLSV